MPLKVNIKTIGKRLQTHVTIKDGSKVVFKTTFGALILEHCLSGSGKYWVANFANSSHEDSGKTFIFSLPCGEQIFEGYTEGGFIQSFQFTDDDRLFAKYQYGLFELDFAGKLVERRAYLQKMLEEAGTDLIYSADWYLQEYDYSPEAMQKMCDAMDRAFNKLIHEYHGKTWGASALRVKGELLEKLGKDEEALQAYTDALYLNGKVGVKNKAKAIYRRLGIEQGTYQPTRLVKIFACENDISSNEQKQRQQQEREDFFLENAKRQRQQVLAERHREKYAKTHPPKVNKVMNRLLRALIVLSGIALVYLVLSGG
ncbi:hypothetical protein PL75_03190 [Neisseria arctica]|uniref:Uncharacterized protein n=1 Tax=Neisseria arctica TaxID=1470200 RepID=A0A0J1C4L1_9NEIS|nr:hypothetical protein [Neisseria arctica]KLT73248.1 hypothetical protein PL75_03190 [Neisseria arctica]UOO87502.1 hypothetical protein LVJ86_04455 [Neisseria arctica]